MLCCARLSRAFSISFLVLATRRGLMPSRSSLLSSCEASLNLPRPISVSRGAEGVWPEQLRAWDNWQKKNKDLVDQWRAEKKAGTFKFFKNKKAADKAEIAHLLISQL